MSRRNSPVLTGARWVMGTLFVIFLLVLFGVSEGNPVENQIIPSAGSTVPAPAIEDGTTVTVPMGTDVLQTP